MAKVNLKKPALLKALSLALVLFQILLLPGCGGGANTSASGSDTMPQTESRDTEPKTLYSPPAALYPVFSSENAAETPVGSADFGSTADGYIAFRAQSEKRLKLQIIKDGETYTYDLPGDGGDSFFPLNMGDGEYTARIMENIESNKYTEIYKNVFEAALKDEFQPFLRPSVICEYSADSESAKVASELIKSCADDTEAVGAVYKYLTENISYDYDKAKTVANGYLPLPDSTLAEKKGICFDYASLAAAMLRSIGIPTKIITGYVSPDEIYHAWNKIYIKNEGWITYEIKAPANNWSRVDITFAASGTDAESLMNDSLYTTRYTY